MKLSSNLLTAGEFARLSQTTKRTIQWYAEKGILKPVKINSKGYRFYKPEQIIDLQVVMLLRRLNFSLAEIKKSLKNSNSLKSLFKLKQETVKDEIIHLQKSLLDISKFYNNLEKSDILINPVIKTVEPFSIYYLEKVGPYAKIYDYGLELKSYFSSIPRNSTYLTIFNANQYLPKKDQFKIAVIASPKMKLKKSAENIIKKEVIPEFKALSYTHAGSPALISLFWKQIRDYEVTHNIKRSRHLPFFEIEFYFKSGLNDFHNEDNMISELCLPIG